jgi:hypothetical protein
MTTHYLSGPEQHMNIGGHEQTTATISYLLNKTFASQLWELTPANLATWEVEIGRIIIWGQPRQKVLEIPSQPMAECGVCVYHPSYAGKHK